MEPLFPPGRRGLLGLRTLLDVLGEHGGVAGDDTPPRNPRGDVGHDCLAFVNCSPLIICFTFVFKSFCVSGSLSHLRNSSSTLTFKTGFSAI